MFRFKVSLYVFRSSRSSRQSSELSFSNTDVSRGSRAAAVQFKCIRLKNRISPFLILCILLSEPEAGSQDLVGRNNSYFK